MKESKAGGFQLPLQPNYKLPLGIEDIMRLLPHRYPLLLVDRVESYDPDTGVVAIKNVTFNEPYFNGHFPGHPVMPGIMMIEAMAQTAILGWRMTRPREVGDGKTAYFTTIDKARFRRPVVPGDRLELRVNLVRAFRERIYHFRGVAYVGEEMAAEADYSAAVVNMPGGADLAS